MTRRGLLLKPGATQEQYLWFGDVAQRAYDCRHCPRMEAHSAVLGPLNGRLEARVLVVGEAPGRFGAAVTRIPFRGDRSGENFERLLPSAGLRREDLFIANAAQCNPKDDKGRNDAPTPRELRNCSGYLREMLDIIQPLYIVTLGRKALDALHIIEPHAVSLSGHVATAVPWRNATLVPLYHPSGRALARRPFSQQTEDYAALGHILRADPRLVWADVPQEPQYAAPV